MIKPQELRVGNLISWNPALSSPTSLSATQVEVVSIMPDKIGFISPGIEHRAEPFEDDRLETDAPQRPLAEFEPVPLTPVLLKKCNPMQLEKIQKLLLTSDDAANEFWFGIEPTKRRLEYFHQLQNLYADFIGEELQAAM